MSNENQSKKQILKSSSIIGGASFVTILIGLVKFKALALLLGPTGIGLIGMLTTIMATGATFFGMGLSISGVRELALNSENFEKLNLIRKALFSANIFLGLLAVIVIFSLRSVISEWFFQSADYQFAISIIGVGIFFSLISGSQTTLLQGLRKVTELAKVKVIGALTSTLIGLLIIWQFGEAGLPFIIIILPLASFFVALFYSRKLPRASISKISLKQLKMQWQGMFTIGFTFMLTGLMGLCCQLIVRYIINQELNFESLGYFQAAWTISMTYISLVLGAMAADYYPRLTQQADNKNEANRLVNEQTEIAIVFSAPILIVMLAFAPLIINLLYSSEFNNSIEILRWQVFGDVLKVFSWPLSWLIIAKGRSKLFFCIELVWNSSYILLVFIGINSLGIEIVGYAFAFSYLIYLILVYVFSRSINDFQWTNHNARLILTFTFVTSSLLLTSYLSLLATMALGFVLAVLSTIYAVKTISDLGIKNHKLEKILSLYRKCASSLGFKI